jgi:hypothetical protein
MEDVGIFYVHLVYIAAIWKICRHFVYFMLIWYIFHYFGKLRKKNLATLFDGDVFSESN